MLWARRLIPVIKIVTAFTIAHSITRSLAALGIVVIPSGILEPAIAASIVFVAIEKFFSQDIDRRRRVTFVFGLIHGFGFAGALEEIGLLACRRPGTRGLQRRRRARAARDRRNRDSGADRSGWAGGDRQSQAGAGRNFGCALSAPSTVLGS